MAVSRYFLNIVIFFADIRARYLLMTAIFLILGISNDKKGLRGCLIIELAGDFLWFLLLNAFKEYFYSIWMGSFCILISLRLLLMAAAKCPLAFLPIFIYASAVFYMFYINMGIYLYGGC